MTVDKKSLIALVLLLAVLGAVIQSGRDMKATSPAPPAAPATQEQAVSPEIQAQRIWDEEKARLGDNVQAKRIAAGKIALLPGVRSASVTATGDAILIDDGTGVRKTLSFRPDRAP